MYSTSTICETVSKFCKSLRNKLSKCRNYRRNSLIFRTRSSEQSYRSCGTGWSNKFHKILNITYAVTYLCVYALYIAYLLFLQKSSELITILFIYLNIGCVYDRFNAIKISVSFYNYWTSFHSFINVFNIDRGRFSKCGKLRFSYI